MSIRHQGISYVQYQCTSHSIIQKYPNRKCPTQPTHITLISTSDRPSHPRFPIPFPICRHFEDWSGAVFQHSGRRVGDYAASRWSHGPSSVLDGVEERERFAGGCEGGEQHQMNKLTCIQERRTWMFRLMFSLEYGIGVSAIC